MTTCPWLQKYRALTKTGTKAAKSEWRVCGENATMPSHLDSSIRLCAFHHEHEWGSLIGRKPPIIFVHPYGGRGKMGVKGDDDDE